MMEADKDKLNDVILPAHEGFGSRHFYIKYSNDYNCYLIKDLGEGSGTFIKVQKQYVLKNGHIVSFGDNHMVVGIIVDKEAS
jgi:FHA domain